MNYRNHENYPDFTAALALAHLDQEESENRLKQMKRMAKGGMVYVLVPGSEGRRAADRFRLNQPVVDFVARQGMIPCMNDTQRLQDEEMEEIAYRERAVRLMTICTEVWIFGGGQSGYPRRVCQDIQRARKLGRRIRFFYFDNVSDIVRPGTEEERG